MRQKLLILLLVFLGIAVPLFSMGKTETVGIRQDDMLGNFLVDGKGMTLYYFDKDTPGVSNWMAKARESDAWPVFYTESVSSNSSTIMAEDFGTIMRKDGSRQTTFRGYPLYYFTGDTKPGDVNGQGKGNVWFIVNPETFQIEKMMVPNSGDKMKKDDKAGTM